MKILLLDIENAPPGWWAFEPKRVKYLSAKQQREKGEILCFSAKWLGRPKIFFHSVPKDTSAGMIEAAWRLLDEADAVMTYYGRQHDIKHLNREFSKAGLGPPSPYKQIDLYYVIRANFAFDYYGLDYVAKEFGLKGKLSSGGLAALNACRDGDPAAWRKMERYNKQDVRLLEELYELLQPWIKAHPSYGAHQGADVCPKCGNDDLERRGFTITNTGKYQRYHCQGCGAWSRSSRRITSTQIVEAA